MAYIRKTTTYGKKKDWPTIAARIPKELKEDLIKKHPNEGEISNVLYALVERYVQGKILGLKFT